MIVLKNAQRTVPVNTRQLRKLLQVILGCGGYSDWDVGLKIIDNRAMARLNKKYRNVEGPTDILSFAHNTFSAPECFSTASPSDERDLGDLVVSAEYVASYCRQSGVAESEHWQVLLVHGIVHLIGYDHEREEDFLVMQAKENALLKSLRHQHGEMR